MTRFAPVGLFLLVLTGCGPDDSFAALHPLSGTITRGGKPVTEGGIIFIPDSGNWRGMVVNAAVKPDGTFSAETSRTTALATTIQPGAPLGTFKVVYHPPSDGQKSGLETELAERITVEAKSNMVTLVLPTGDGEKKDDSPKPPAADTK